MLSSLKSFKTYVFITLGFISGILVCIVIKKGTILSIDNSVGFEINPLEIFTIIINIGLAIYVTKIVSKKNDDRKSEKELVIKEFLDYKSHFTSTIDALILQEDYDSIDTKSNFKILRRKFHSLIQLSKLCKVQTIESEGELVKIKDKINDIWELFTDTPRSAAKGSPTFVIQSTETLRLEKKNKIEILLIEVQEMISSQILKINNF